MKRNALNPILSSVLLAASLISARVVAEEVSAAESRLPEELVVSGFRTTSAQELDSSITLLDRSTLDQPTVEHFQDLVQFVPNMNYSGEGSRPRYFQLRGIGEREQYEGAPNPSVGFIVDDIELSGIGGVASTFDVEQVEVLRGPQSARYGSSALAGVVYMQSAMPNSDYAANVEITGGNEDIFGAGAAVGGALSESVSARFSVHQYQDNGFRDNDFKGQDDTNDRDELTVRGKLGWQVGADWEVLLAGLYADFDNGYDAWTVRNDDTTWSNNPGSDRQKTKAGSLKVSGPLSTSVDLVSITSVADSEIDFSYDGDWGNADFWLAYGNYGYDFEYVNPRDRESYSQEFRLVSGADGRLFADTTDWVIGAYWRQLKEGNEIDSTGIYSDVGEEGFCVPFCATDRKISSRYKANTWALFGGTDTALTDDWSLSLGLRLERWDANYSDVWNDINFAGPPDSRTCNVSGIDCNPDEDMWGGHIALSYAWSPELQTYGRIARGFKAGGFNPSLAALQGSGALLGEEFLTYDPEYLMNYELGIKGAWLGQTLRADLSVFYMDRDDAQLSQSSQQVAFDPNSFVFVTYNGKADVYGLEASALWQIVPVLELHGSLGLLQSDIQSTGQTELVSPDAVNRDLAHAPNYTASIGLNYRDGRGWFGGVDLSAVDAFYFDISHNGEADSRQVVDARVGKQWGQLSLTVWGKNIFDEGYNTRGFFFGNEPGDFVETLYTKFGDPRTYGVTLNYTF